MLTIGASHVNAFAGLNGGSADELGFKLQDASFALALMADQAAPARKWTALSADVGSIAFVGVDSVTIVAEDISVNINSAALATDAVVDFAASPLAVATGPGSFLDIDLDGDKGALTAVQIGRATLAISDYIYVSGGFYFAKSSGLSVDVVTGLPAAYPATMDPALRAGLGKLSSLAPDHSRIEGLQVDTTTLSASNVKVFAGLGPYFVDANDNGLFDDDESLNPDAIGINLDGIDFGLVLMDSSLLADPDSVVPKLFALKLDWQHPLDIDWDFFKFQVDGLTVSANQGDLWRGGKLGSPFADFTTLPDGGLEIPTTGAPIVLDYDRAFLGVSIDHALLNVGDFFQIEGGFAFEKASNTKVDVVTGLPALPVGPAAGVVNSLASMKTAGYLSADNSRLNDLPMDVMSFGASDVVITIGDTSDPLFVIDGIDIGFTLMRATKAVDPAAVVPTLYAMKATWAHPLDVDWDFMRLKVDGLSVRMNQGGNWTAGLDLAPYIDFTSSFGAQGLEIGTGGDPVFIDFDHPMIGVAVEHALITIDNFFFIEGGFAIEKSSSVVLDLATGFGNADPAAAAALAPLVSKGYTSPGHYSRIEGMPMNGMTLGLSDVNLFVGSGPYFVDSNDDGVIDSADERNSDAIGLVVENLDLALAIFTDPSRVVPKLWALSATSDLVSFTGVEGLTIEASGAHVAANQGGVWNGTTISPNIDFISSFGAGGLRVATGNDPVALDFQAGYVGVQIARATLAISEFVYVQGAFSFEKGQRQKVTIDTGLTLGNLAMAPTIAYLETVADVSSDWAQVSNLAVESLTIGMRDVDVFVGYGKPDFDSATPIREQGQLFGLAVSDVDLALAILTPTAKQVKLPTFIALKASAGEFIVAGGQDLFELSGHDIEVQVNWSTGWQGVANSSPSIDFGASFPAGGGLLVPTGAEPILLDFKGAFIQAVVQDALLAVSEFVHLSGDFAFRRGGSQEITVNAGLLGSISGVRANSIEFGANNVQAFVGVNGPYRDANDAINADAIGLVIDKFDFGMTILTTETPDILRPETLLVPAGTKFTALKAHGEQIGFVGFGDFIEFSLNDVNVGVNSSSRPGLIADFTNGGQRAGYSVATGGAPVLLDFNNAIIEASVGHALASVAGIVSLEGGFAFQKRSLRQIGFNAPGLEIIAPAQALVVAGKNIYGFAGINGPYRSDTTGPAGVPDGLIDELDPASEDAIGFAIDDLDFAMAMVAPAAAAGLPVPGVNFYSFAATAARAGLVGTDPFLTLGGWRG